MDDVLLIYEKDTKMVAAHIKGGALFYLLIHDGDNPSLVGNIYRGRVLTRVGKTSAFVIDLGEGKTGYLQLEKSQQEPTLGQSLQVKVRRDAVQSKAPKLALLNLETESALPALLEEAPDVIQSYILKQAPGHVMVELGSYAPRVQKVIDDVEVVPNTQKVFDVYPVEEALEELLTNTYSDDTGWHLKFEVLETATFIDVNAGACLSSAEDINRAVAPVMMDHIRLRNIAGLILVDFLKVKGAKAQKPLLDQIKSKAAMDPIQTDVLGFTKAGLVEILRQRTTPALAHYFPAKD